MNATLNAALTYAARGLPVFPLNPNSKEPHGLLAPNGFKNATTNPDIIRQWFTEFPAANLAIAIPEGVIVVDIDPRNGGDVTWDELSAGRTVNTLTSISGRGDGGFHLWLNQPPDIKLNTKLGPGVDVKAGGKGYIVAPPSIHPDSGLPYTWADQGDTTNPPEWLVDALTKQEPPAPTVHPTIPNRESGTTQIGTDDVRPGDHFTDSTTWEQLLTADGWTPVEQHGHEYRWRRPGKTTGISAVVNHNQTDRLKCFTSSVPGLDDNGTYDRFGYWAATRHNGDHRAAAVDLAQLGYGTGAQPIDLTWIVENNRTVNTVTGEISEPWPTLIPLGDNQTTLPLFPTHILPTWLAEMCVDVAENVQVPVDLPAAIGLAALSAATAGRVLVAWDDWTTATNLYMVVAMPPGAGKSPVFSAMVGPLEDHEVDLAEAASKEISETNSRMRKAKAALKRAEEKGDEIEMALRLAETNSINVPASPRIIIEDTTPEALVKILGEQQGRIALMSTEGGLFEVMTGRYGEKRSNLEPYLQAWSGDTIKVDRMGRDTIIVRKPYLTVGITVQPQVLMALAERPELAGRGLTSRFMYALPESNVGKRNMRRRTRRADKTIRAAYAARLVELHKIMSRYQNPGMLILNDPAADLFGDWRQDLEDRLDGGDLVPLAEWISKLQASVLRLAGILHLAHGKPHSGDIEPDIVADAITVGDYWLAHAFAVHDLWGTDPILRDARAILEWIDHNGLTQFTLRDVYSHSAFRRKFDKAEKIEEPLKLLVERGWVKGDVKTGQRGTPKPMQVNPAVIELRAMRAQLETHSEDPNHKHAGQSVELRAMRAMPLVQNHASNTHINNASTPEQINEGGCAHGAHGAQLAPPPQPVDNSTDDTTTTITEEPHVLDDYELI